MNAKMAATMEGKMQKLKDNFNQFFIALGKPINETIKPELDKLNNYDFSTLGKNLGDNIAAGMGGLTDGTMWRIWSLRGFAAIADMGNNLSNSIMAAVEAGFQSAFGKGGKTFADYLIENLDAVSGAETEFGKMLRQNAEVLEKENARRFKNRRREQILNGRLDGAAAADSVFGDLFAGIDKPQAAPVTVEVKPEASQPSERAFDWQASRMETNDMQRRGLSLNADGGASQAAKAIDFLAKIADILNTAKITDRALTWT